MFFKNSNSKGSNSKTLNTSVNLDVIRKYFDLNGACSREFVDYVMDNLHSVDPRRLTASVKIVKDKYSDTNYRYTYLRLDGKRILLFIKYGTNVSVEYDLSLLKYLSKTYA